MSHIQIAILNRSSAVSDAEVDTAVAALQKQVSNDFAPVWGIDADLSFIDAQSAPQPGQWWLVILDNSDQAGALGYHDLTDDGLPLGKVFAQTDLQYEELWTVTASHELLEMLVDPDINLAAINDLSANNSTRLYAYEVCDACESDDAAYQIDGVSVSDFVYPAWFESLWLTAANKPQFDHQKLLTTPFELSPGGYISVMDVTSQQGWVQIFGSAGLAYSMRARVGSRRERRRIGRTQWQRSEPRSAGAVSPSC
jgi:hypothetical protein